MTDSPEFKEWVSSEVRALGGSPRCDAISGDPGSVVVEIGDSIRGPAYICGVYHLLLCGVVQYVGQSGNVYSRIAQHMAGAPFEFDSFEIYPCPAAELLAQEAKAIAEARPAWNKELPAHGGAKHQRRQFPAR